MTNADLFKKIFGIYSTEIWAMPEENFLKWHKAEATNEEKWTPVDKKAARRA